MNACPIRVPRLLAGACALAVLLPAHADARVSIGVGLGPPPVVVQSPPSAVYVRPAPVYVRPGTVMVAPPPVVYSQPPVDYSQQGVFVQPAPFVIVQPPYGHGWHGHRRDRDDEDRRFEDRWRR